MILFLLAGGRETKMAWLAQLLLKICTKEFEFSRCSGLLVLEHGGHPVMLAQQSKDGDVTSVPPQLVASEPP
jgi:hypothetical protein